MVCAPDVMLCDEPTGNLDTATGYGIMNLVSISCGGFGDWAFGVLRDQHVPLNAIFGTFAGVALLSVGIVMLIKPQPQPGNHAPHGIS